MWMIISDSHDNMDKITKSIKIAKENNVVRVIHLGDFISPFAIAPFTDGDFEFNAVFGNNDGELLYLQKRAMYKISNSPHWMNTENKRLYLMHEPFALYPAIRSQLYDFVFFGHTHRLTIKRYDKTLVINPGESCGYLTGKATCVLLNPENSWVRVIEL